MVEQRTERFTAWGGRVAGIIGLAVVAGVVVVGVAGSADLYDPAVYPVCGLIALLIWSTMIRPEVAVADGRLVLRNPFTTVRLPLAAIEQVVVRQWLAVRMGERQFTSAGIGRSRRQALRDDRKGEDSTDRSYAAVVEARIHRLAEDARDRAGIALCSEEQEALADDVRREPAWVEIGFAVVLVLALVITLLA